MANDTRHLLGKKGSELLGMNNRDSLILTVTLRVLAWMLAVAACDGVLIWIFNLIKL